MSRYATSTTVAPDRSRAHIERVLRRYGAASFMYGWDAGRGMVAFVLNGSQIRFTVPMPSVDDPELTETPTGRPRSGAARERAYEQAERQVWRALHLVIHAKLEAVAAGVTSLEDEFLAFRVLPNGQTVGERLAPDLAAIAAGRPLPALLPESSPTQRRPHVQTEQSVSPAPGDRREDEQGHA